MLISALIDLVLWSSGLERRPKTRRSAVRIWLEVGLAVERAHRTLPTEHGIDTEIGAVYTVFGDKGNGLSSKFLDPWALCAHLDPMPRR